MKSAKMVKYSHYKDLVKLVQKKSNQVIKMADLLSEIQMHIVNGTFENKEEKIVSKIEKVLRKVKDNS